MSSLLGGGNDNLRQIEDFDSLDIKPSPSSSASASIMLPSPKDSAGRTRVMAEICNLQLASSNSASDDDQQAMEERKQKRMLSNRESARRSRQRKQQHLEELREQLFHLRAENSRILSDVATISQQFVQMKEQNHCLHIHAIDLSQQLQRLNQQNQITIQCPDPAFNAEDRGIQLMNNSTLRNFKSSHSSVPSIINPLPLP